MVVPTYNEKDRLGDLARALFEAADSSRLALELVIVDDNSPDGTGAIADELARKYRIKVIHRAGKLGLGTAVVAGFAVASAEIVGVMDADFSHPPSLVPRMHAVFHATGADVLVAPRLSVIVDLFGERVIDSPRLISTTSTRTGAAGSVTLDDIHFVSESYWNAAGSFGMKGNIASRMLVTFNLRFALTEGGLTDRLSPLLGVEWSF